MRLFAAGLALGLLLSVPGTAAARDWFVRAGSADGDGTLAKPFADPWQALEKYEAGDRINVAAGQYFGKLDVGTWRVPMKVELLGGYDQEFKERNPWKNFTELLWKKGSKNMSDVHRVMVDIMGGGNTDGVVVDGFVMDMKDANFYVDDDATGLAPGKARCRGTIQFSSSAVTLRNNVIVNAEFNAIQVGPGSTIENNLLVNSGQSALEVRPGAPAAGKSRTSIKNNTFAFVWWEKGFGKGGPGGHGLYLHSYADIVGNVFMGVDNQAVYFPDVTGGPLQKSTLKDNVFWMNLYANVRGYVDGADSVADSASMDQIEDMGFKEQGGNEVLDCQFELDPKWMDKYSQRSAGERGKVSMDDWNKARRVLGLPLIAQAGKAYDGYMPAYDWKKALAFVSPKNAACKAGAREKKLEVPKFEGAAAGPARDWQKTTLSAIKASPGAFNGKYVEFQAAMGGTYNPGSFTAGGVKPDTHDTMTIYDPEGTGTSIAVAARKGTSTHRAMLAASTGTYNGTGKPARLQTYRGQVATFNAVIKVGLVAEVIEDFTAAAVGAARPLGRDWFVRAGAGGGDGTKEKPFKDPFQALEKAEMGDTIHVAEGEYFGKTKSGLWKISTKFLSMLGGYDKEFTQRDPWAHPTFLGWPPDSKTMPLGYTIEGDGAAEGVVVDGFVFDKKARNIYQSNGDLLFSKSDTRESVLLIGPNSAVRNCLFVNHALKAVRQTDPFVLDNNIFFNNTEIVTEISGGTPERTEVTNNSFIFSWEYLGRFNDSHGANGMAITIRRGPVLVENNVFQFMDNDGLRIYADPKTIELVGNVFDKNLYTNVRINENQVIDDKAFGKLCDVGWKRCSGNVVDNPNFDIDTQWFEVYLNRTALVPGKVTMDDWNTLRQMLGMPVQATGGKKGEGIAPAYDWRKALKLVPRNPKVKAGARPVKLEVRFAGAAATDPTAGKSYQEVPFEKLRDDYQSLAGQRVQVRVALGSFDTSSWHPASHSDKNVWKAVSMYPTSGKAGATVRGLVKQSTAVERTIGKAPDLKEFQKPEAIYLVKGVVLPDKGYLEVEGAQKAEGE